MNNFKKILVPTDFSACAAEAISSAAELSRRYEASVTLVHVFEPATLTVPDGFLFYMPGQVEKLLAEYGKALAAAKKTAEAAGAARVEVQQLQGIAADEIVALAAKDGFDLIVIGTHGRTGIQHALIGSIAERVVRRAPCPVLTVKTARPAH